MSIAFLIKNQSFVDVITNSSSELFVCDTDKSVEFTETLLRKILDLHNEVSNTDYSFEHVFDSVKCVGEEDIEKFIEDYVIGWSVGNNDLNIGVPNYYDFSEQMRRKLGWKANIKTDEERQENNRIWDEVRNAWEELKTKWITENLDYLKSIFLGRILICSIDDNSIPYELFNTIEYSFNADRYHLG